MDRRLDGIGTRINDLVRDVAVLTGHILGGGSTEA
jgi:hypothetical protein